MKIGDNVRIIKEGYNSIGNISGRDSDLYEIQFVDFDGVVIFDYFTEEELEPYFCPY